MTCLEIDCSPRVAVLKYTVSMEVYPPFDRRCKILDMASLRRGAVLPLVLRCSGFSVKSVVATTSRSTRSHWLTASGPGCSDWLRAGLGLNFC